MLPEEKKDDTMVPTAVQSVSSIIASDEKMNQKTQQRQEATVVDQPNLPRAGCGTLPNQLINSSHAFKQHFSSTPLDPDTCSVLSEGSGLTHSERNYLENLWKEGDIALIERAKERLCDPILFPPLVEKGSPASRIPNSEEEEDADSILGDNNSRPALAVESRTPVRENLVKRKSLQRRDSAVQQELFRLHETQAVHPSQVLKRMNLAHMNSIIDSGGETDNETILSGESHGKPSTVVGPSTTVTDTEKSKEVVEVTETSTTALPAIADHWNPFKDVSSWLDGSQGIEVGDNGVPIQKKVAVQQPVPFRILGTAADDVSCHPHVMSPPLMESLLAFVPESQAQQNFWLKYSLVRDGPSLWTMLRHVRASVDTFLAIETIDGHVFGAFTCQPWRLAQGWYGNQDAIRDTFLWKMRRSRLETTESIVQQANQESEIQVFPHRPGNHAVQYCSKEHLLLGKGELFLPPNSKATELGGKHFGCGLHLDASLQFGYTSNCETFGNPCLVDPTQKGARFEISNLEVWTLTPHDSVKDAEQSELSMLFLEGGRAGTENLNVMRILVGGPI